jgi:hypothetical protein
MMTLMDFMLSIRTQCLTRQESWWTYEVCFQTPNAPADLTIKPKKQTAQQRLLQQINKPEENPPFVSGARQYRLGSEVTQEGNQIKYTPV